MPPTVGRRGAALEIFKFGLYLFVPFFVMVQYGNPAWYKRHVLPYKERILPKEEESYKPPKTYSEVTAELQRLKAEKLKRKLGEEHSD